MNDEWNQNLINSVCDRLKFGDCFSFELPPSGVKYIVLNGMIIMTLRSGLIAAKVLEFQEHKTKLNYSLTSIHKLVLR